MKSSLHSLHILLIIYGLNSTFNSNSKKYIYKTTINGK